MHNVEVQTTETAVASTANEAIKTAEAVRWAVKSMQDTAYEAVDAVEDGNLPEAAMKRIDALARLAGESLTSMTHALNKLAR